MSGIGPEEFSNVYNLVISTKSAKILAKEFEPSFLEFWLPLITVIASTIAAFLSFFTAKKSAEMSHNLFVNELDKEYQLLSRKLFEEYTPELPLSNKNKKSMCNFFEKICSLYFRKVINEKELSVYQADLTNNSFIDYAKNCNELGSYKKWLHSQKLF